MAKFKIKHTISKKEWNKTHKDFKSIIDGIHYVMKYDNKTGTHLVPVNIEESVNEYLSPSDVDSKMKEMGINKIPISSQGERVLKGMVKEKFLDKVTNKERLIYFVESLGKEKFGYGTKGKPLSKLVGRFWNDITSDGIFFGGKMAAYQVAMNMKDMKSNGEEIDSPYEMMKEYFKNFGMDYSRSRVFNSAIRNLEDWMKRNKMQESVNEEKINRKKLSNDLWDRKGYDYKYLNKLSDKKLKSLWDTEFYYESVNEGKDDFMARHGRANINLKKGYKHHTVDELEDLYNKLGKLVKGLKVKDVNLVFESVNENDGVYFKSYTAAIEAARAAALKKGFEVEDDEMFTKVGMNSKRPSVGKTTKVSLELVKNGKPQRKMLHIQVYGMKNGYELNSYIN